MEVTYLKLFVDYLDAIAPLGDAERGRLFTALLTYSRTGEAPELGGNERFLFPMMKSQIDRDIAALSETSEKRSEAGKKGAEAKQANASKSGKCQQVPAKVSKSSKEEDKDKDKDKDKEIERVTRASRFTPPTVDDVKAYCFERGNHVDASRFVDFYASKGWKVGSTAMKDWKAAVRTWEKRDGAKDTPEKASHQSKSFSELIAERGLR